MTMPMRRNPRVAAEPPTGWPIGSYPDYLRAQRAVDHLADSGFPVADVTIVGVDLMQVERVVGRLTWGRVLTRGLLTGAWWGLFLGLMLSIFSPSGAMAAPLVTGLTFGVMFGVTFEAIGYAATRGRRDFTSTTMIVAGRYDVICAPTSAERGRDLLASLDLRGDPR